MLKAAFIENSWPQRRARTDGWIETGPLGIPGEKSQQPAELVALAKSLAENQHVAGVEVIAPDQEIVALEFSDSDPANA